MMASVKEEFGLVWSAPVQHYGASGPRMLQRSTPSTLFYMEWAKNKQGMMSKGYALVKNGSGWEVLKWTNPTEEPPVPSL